MATTPPSSDPQVTQTDTKIVGTVNQATFQQANPTAASQYDAYVVQTQNNIVAAQTKELEATQGYPASENQIAAINGAAFGTATVAANIKFKDNIEEARAAQSVPADTPPPTIAPASIDAPLPTISETDPNFISNPDPVDNTIDPETPQPVAEFGGGKRFEPAPIDEFGPPPNDADPNFISNPTLVAPESNPEVPQPQPVQNYFTDATPAPVENYFTDATPTPIVQNYFTDATPVNPTANPQVPEPPIVQNYFVDEAVPVQNYFTDATPVPIVQNYFTDATPVQPASNPQVPNIFSSIGALLSNLFGITPVPVTPAANPQVAQAIPVTPPATITATPIPPVSNPQVPPTPIVQNYFTDATPTPVVPAANPQVPEPPIVQNYFVDEPAPIVQNYFTDAAPAPIVQNYFTDATPVSPTSNPEVPQPTPPAPTAESVVNKANPTAAQDRFALKSQIERELQPQIARELQEQNPTWSPSRVFATSQLRASAQADAAVDFRLDQEITAASLNPPTVAPATNPEVPQPTAELGGGKRLDPEVVDSPAEPTVQAQADTRIDGPVNQAVLQQESPSTASAYNAYVVDTQNKIVEQQTRELEASQGYPASENQIAAINGQAFGTATIAANVKFKDNIEAAKAAPSVPADTPPPTIVPADVSDPVYDRPSDVDPNFISNPGPVNSTIDPEVPSSANVRIENVNQSQLAATNPELYQQWQTTFTARAEKDAANEIKLVEAELGRPVNAEERATIESVAAFRARNDTNAIYKDELQAANVATVVPTDTPPPTATAPAVAPESNAQVPAATGKITDFSYSTLAIEDPDTARALITEQRAIQQELANQQVAEYRAVTGTAPGTPIPDEEVARITVETDLAAKAQVQTKYQDQIVAAGAGTLVPTDTPPPTTTAPAVNSATNQQVPPAAAGEPLVDPQTGEVLGYVDTATGDITDTPTTVGTADPQVPSLANSQIASVDQSKLSQFDSAFFNDYNSAVVNNTTTAEAQLTNQALATYGVSNVSDLPLDVQLDIREQALTTGVTEANAEFKDQLEASGAATSEPAGTPPPTPAPAPPSPSPYEIFLAQEAAATTAAEAEATARFNSQFDVVTEDPQVAQAIPVTEPGAIEAVPLDNNTTDYSDFIGVTGADPEPVNYNINDAEPGFDNFYGNDTGEFQDLALEPTPAEPVDYGDFIGGTGEDTAFVDYGEELGNGNAESAGFSDFFGADAAADVGEFQAEPAAGDGESAGFSDFFGGVGDFLGGITRAAGAVSPGSDPQANAAQRFAVDSASGIPQSAIKTPNQLAAERQAAAVAQAKAQQEVNAQRKQANEGDWRVRLRLAGGADYLYKAKDPGILKPLVVTDGVIFPYTPQIQTQYQAKYNPYELTHSNYKGYFYQGSSVGDININATFTAQDTSEANYLLAVIHFFRSVTKMFYGQDDASKRGAPPPLVFLQGLGEYQFNLHPCVVTSFNYTLPADVDYIRANSVNFDGTNLLQRRDRQNLPIEYVNSATNRLSNAGLTKGGLSTPPPPPTLGTNSPTYVPTKIEIQLVLLPVQTRSQVSQQFSLKQFANGDLIRGGFW